MKPKTSLLLQLVMLTLLSWACIANYDWKLIFIILGFQMIHNLDRHVSPPKKNDTKDIELTKKLLFGDRDWP